MSKRLFTALALLIVASMALAACGGAPTTPAPVGGDGGDGGDGGAFVCDDAIGCLDIAPDEPVHLAYMLTISGATAFLGEDSVGGIEIAIDDRGGELLGHPIQLTGEDSGCSAEGGQTAATIVASDPTIVGVVGTNCSSSATAAMSTLMGAGLVMISPSNTAPALTLEGETWQEGYFRACHTDLFQGAVAAEFAYNELGATTAATIHDGSPYADQLQAVFSDRFAELGGTVTFQGAVNVGDTDMRTILTSVAADSPDILYFPIFEPEGPFIVQQSGEIEGLEDTILMGADGLLVDSFPENAGANAVGMYLSGPYVSGASYDDFLAKWEAKYGGVPPSGFHAFAYDGTNILLDAVEAVAVQDADGTLHVGRQALRDAMAATDGFQGLTGTLSCGTKEFAAGTSHGDCATGSALGIFEITDAEVTGGNWPPEAIFTPGG
ncbi:MAG TPA: branched-chain amino acid ABC transporter substrate-binding protein [Anaerolineales bacterium]